MTSHAIIILQAAMQKAMANRPKVGGFPYLAETLRQAGVIRNVWFLPSAQSIYVMGKDFIVNQGTPLMTGMVDIPSFNQVALITALRINQAGNSTFPEFLIASWEAGVIRYEVDFIQRTVTYYGVNDEFYEESYPEVEVL